MAYNCFVLLSYLALLAVTSSQHIQVYQTMCISHYPTYQCIDMPDIPQCQMPEEFPIFTSSYDDCISTCTGNLYCIEFCQTQYNMLPAQCQPKPECKCSYYCIYPKYHPEKCQQCDCWHQEINIPPPPPPPQPPCEPMCCVYFYQPTYYCIAKPDLPACNMPNFLPIWTNSFDKCMRKCLQNLICEDYCETRFQKTYNYHGYLEQPQEQCRCPHLTPQPEPRFVSGVWYFSRQYNLCAAS